jgi:hypothetical protein
MQSILAIVLHSHDKHDAWSFKIKIKPKLNADISLALNEAPSEYCHSKLLGIAMDDLWKVVLIDCNCLAKKMGKRGNLIDRNGIQQFFTNNELTNLVVL